MLKTIGRSQGKKAAAVERDVTQASRVWLRKPTLKSQAETPVSPTPVSVAESGNPAQLGTAPRRKSSLSTSGDPRNET